MSVVATIRGRAMGSQGALTIPLLQGLDLSSDQLPKFFGRICVTHIHIITHISTYLSSKKYNLLRSERRQEKMYIEQFFSCSAQSRVVQGGNLGYTRHSHHFYSRHQW